VRHLPYQPYAIVKLRTAFLLLLLTVPALAQDPKRGDLVTRAQTLFDDQQYEESVQALSAALLRPGQSREQRIRVYRLLALNYITLGRMEEAESAVRALLVIDPNYALPPSESPKFRNFFSEAKTRWEADGRPGFQAEAPKPVVLKHSPPPESEAGHALELRARLEDPAHRVSAVKLYTRVGTRGKYTEETLQVSADGSVRIAMSAELIKPPLVEYFLTAFDTEGLPVAARGDAGDPLRIAVSEPSKGWVLPVVIGASVLGAGAILGGLALFGAFKSNNPTPTPTPVGRSAITIIVGD
jgi:tetratricopeptide (TPR) repeat protein